jgi:MraZ protein
VVKNPTNVFKSGENQGFHSSFEKGVMGMLSNNFRHNVDAKNRLFVPAKYREELGETFIVSQSIRGNYLKIYSHTEWEKYIAPIKLLPRKTSEEALRFLIGNSIEVSPDGQGRIVLPGTMLQFASITKGTVIIGCGDYAEIWAEESYDNNQEEQDMEALRAALEDCGL